MPTLYFDIHHAIRTHDELVIEKSGGTKGVLNIGLIDSVLDHIQNDLYYPKFTDKLTHLVFAVNKSHSFQDGNKRTSIALGAYFLQINGYNFCVTKFIRSMENIAVDVADNRIGKELLLKIIVSIIYQDDYSEDLKIEIINAKNK